MMTLLALSDAGDLCSWPHQTWWPGYGAYDERDLLNFLSHDGDGIKRH